MLHGVEAGRPLSVSVSDEKRVQCVVRDMVRSGLAVTAHDLSEGGLAVALAECAIRGRRGARIRLPDVASAEALFGEAPSRVIATVAADRISEAAAQLATAGVPWVDLGEVGGDQLSIEGTLEVGVDELEARWEQTIPSVMSP